jgi:hypothetical protein
MRAYGMHCRDLSLKELAALAAKDVHPDVLGWGDGRFAIKAATVKWDGELWFDFAPEGKRSAIIVCLDEHGQPADLAAWSPADGRTGLCWGNIAMIGQEQVGVVPRLDGDKLWVHPSPLEWLLHRRAGVVIINHEAARPILVGASPIAVKTGAMRAALEEKWRAPRIQVFEEGVAEATINGGVS